MSRTRKTSGHNPRFEVLENRNLLAGNVTTNFAGGLLTLTGDAAANNIQVSQLASGDWQVKGIGTKIDGGNSPETFPGVTDISADLLGGSDTIKVSNGTLTGDIDLEDSVGGNDIAQLNKVTAFNLTVGTGAGNDAITITNCNANADFTVKAGDGSDAVTVNNCFADGNLDIETSDTTADGNDVVHFTGLFSNTLLVNDLHGNDTVVGTNSRTAVYMDFDLTSGNDAIALSGLNSGESILVYVVGGSNVATIHNCTSVGELYIQANDGVEVGRNVITVTDSRSTGEQFSMDLGDGADVVTVNNVTAATSSYLHANGGNNVISINKLNVAGQYTITSLDGNDTISAANVVTGEPTINLGNGNNVLSFVAWRNVGVSDMTVATGNGRDSISIVRCSSTIESLYVNAGDGTNTCVIASCPIAGAIGYTGGDGRDYLTMTNSSGSVINVYTGDDTDVVSLASVSTSGGLFVNMGPGNYDTLAVANCSANTAEFDGGGNTGDTLVKSHNHFGAESDTGFQHVIG